MKVNNAEELVADEEFRKKIIEEINGNENLLRKHEAYKRYQCYKDKTKHYVIEQLLAQFDPETVTEMAYSISNISVMRKIIDKLSRVYSNGVVREGRDDVETKIIQSIENELKLNTTMKKVNRYLKAQRNVLLGVLPVKDSDSKYYLKLPVLQPYQYDVIPDPADPEKAMGIIISSYKNVMPQKSTLEPAKEGRGHQTVSARPQSDGKNQTISDKPIDEQVGDDYIWWFKDYHFTTNSKGEILGSSSIEDIINPIGKLPFISFNFDQDGSYWAEGGDDLVDGAILVNSMITNTMHVGVMQGYGQFYMTGKDLPKNMKVGPTKMIRLEQADKDEPTPQIGFANASPQLDQLKNLIGMYVALLLTTNNLSTSAVAADLQGTSDFPSGVAMIIDKAESTEDVQDQQQIFIDKEPEVFDLITRWSSLYKQKGILNDDLRELNIPDSIYMKLRFQEVRPIISEKEKLENIKLRKDLGINTEVELLMIDNPGMSQEDAEAKLLKIVESKLLNKLKEVTEENDESNRDDSDEREDDDEDRPGDRPPSEDS
jgi:hypothetical protein